MISRDINDDFMVLIKGFEQDPYLGVKTFHPSIDDDIETTDSEKEENNDENSPKTPYDGENVNASSDDEVNNDQYAPETPYDGENMITSSGDEVNNYEVAHNPPTNDVNINDNSDDERNDYEVTPDTPTNDVNNETIDSYEDKNCKEEAENQTDN